MIDQESNIKLSKQFILFAITSIVILAGLLRFYPYMQGPEYQFLMSDAMFEYSEASYVAKTGEMPELETPRFSILKPGFNISHFNIHQILLGYLARWGSFRLGNTIKVVGLLFTTLSVVVLYLLGSKLFDPRVGILSALFVAVSPQHIWMSFKFDDQAFALPFFSLSLFFLINKNYLWLLLSIMTIGLIHGPSAFVFLQVFMIFALSEFIVNYKTPKNILIKYSMLGSILCVFFSLLYNISSYKMLSSAFANIYHPPTVSILEFALYIGPVVFILSIIGTIFFVKKQGIKTQLVIFFLAWQIYILFCMQIRSYQNPIRFITFAEIFYLLAAAGFIELWDMKNRTWYNNTGNNSVIMSQHKTTMLVGVFLVAIIINLFIITKRYQAVRPDGYQAELEAANILRKLPVSTTIVVNQVRPDAQLVFLSGVTSLSSALTQEAMNIIFKTTNISATIDVLKNTPKYEDSEHIVQVSLGKVHASDFVEKHRKPFPKQIKWVVFVEGHPFLYQYDKYIKSYTSAALEKFKEHPDLFDLIYENDGVYLFRIN